MQKYFSFKRVETDNANIHMWQYETHLQNQSIVAQIANAQ